MLHCYRYNWYSYSVTFCQWCHAGHAGQGGVRQWGQVWLLSIFQCQCHACHRLAGPWLLTGDCIARSAADRWIAWTVDRAHHHIIIFDDVRLPFLWFLTAHYLSWTEDKMSTRDIFYCCPREKYIVTEHYQQRETRRKRKLKYVWRGIKILEWLQTFISPVNCLWK